MNSSSKLNNESSFDSSNTGSNGDNAFDERTIEQTMEALPLGTRRLAAQLRTPANFEAIWDVLTSYDRLSEFIPNLVSSNLLSREGNVVKLKQVGSQNFFGLHFSAEVFIELTEDRSKGALRFFLIKGDFRRFEGSWTISKLENTEGCSLVYELTVQGFFGMPVSLIESRLRSDLKRNLLAVEKAASEIELY